MKRPTMSDAAKAMGITIDREVYGHAYARNGNAHRPTERARWNVRAPSGRLIGTYDRHGDAIELANEYAKDPR